MSETASSPQIWKEDDTPELTSFFKGRKWMHISMSEATIVSSGNNNMRGDFSSGVQFSTLSTITALSQQEPMKKRSRPGNPDPDAEVIALSPKTLMATNRFICEICNKGFQREQNLQLHRRGHNLPWKLRQRSSGSDQTRRRVFVCPEPSCVHHDPSRALGDLTGIKKHFCRKHGEKKWKCDKCSKRYAVQSDWKAHSKICGTKEYRCDCGTLFSRKDSFITHRAFCDALAEESAGLSVRFNALPSPSLPPILSDHSPLRSLLPSTLQPYLFQKWNDNLKHQEPVQDTESNPSSSLFTNQTSTQPSPFMAANTSFAGPPSFSSHMSANALLQNNGIVSSTGMKEFQTVGSSLSNLQSLNPLSIWDFSGKDGVGSACLHELQRSNSRIVEERIAEMESVLGGGGGGGRGSLGEVVGSVRICGGVRGAKDLGHGENKEDYGKSRFTRDFLGVEISDGAYGSEHYNSLRSPVVAALRSFSSASQSWEG